VVVWSDGRGTTFEVDGRVMTMITAPNPDTGRVFRIKFDRL